MGQELSITTLQLEVGECTLVTVATDGISTFLNNLAKLEGGGIYARDSEVKFRGKDMFVTNSAESKGAAIHSSFTTLIFQGGSTFMGNSARYGGGIYSDSSNTTFVHQRSRYQAITSCTKCKSFCSDPPTIPENSFLNNTALRGGAQYFDLYSNLSLYQTACVLYQGNWATEFGGAIYAADVLGPVQFLSQQHVPFRSKCSFHKLGNKQSLDLDTTPLIFVKNYAEIRGGVLYGGLLDKCDFASDRHTSALGLFNMSIIHGGRKDDMGYPISSDPTQLCFVT